VSIAYAYDGLIYLAATKACTLACTFCPKTHGRWDVAGNDMERDPPKPSSDELIAAAEAEGLEEIDNVAFVGLGEPTMRLDVLLETAKKLKARGKHVRVVTDGLANARAGEDVTPRFEGVVDEVHVSLNAHDGETYARICPNKFGAEAHRHAQDFIREIKRHVPKVSATCITLPDVDVAGVQKIADDLGVPLRVRPYFDPLTGEPHEKARSVEGEELQQLLKR
jgi:TatD DNase family protein